MCRLRHAHTARASARRSASQLATLHYYCVIIIIFVAYASVSAGSRLTCDCVLRLRCHICHWLWRSIQSERVEDVKRAALSMDYPLMDEYDFRSALNVVK
jgi:hypothetical protein